MGNKLQKYPKAFQSRYSEALALRQQINQSWQNLVEFSIATYFHDFAWPKRQNLSLDKKYPFNRL